MTLRVLTFNLPLFFARLCAISSKNLMVSLYFRIPTATVQGTAPSSLFTTKYQVRFHLFLKLFCIHYLTKAQYAFPVFVCKYGWPSPADPVWRSVCTKKSMASFGVTFFVLAGKV